MQIQHKEEGKKGIFYITAHEEQVAEMTYSLTSPDVITIDHTEVDDSLRGKKIGLQLVNAGADYARSKHYTIIPLCTFAKKVFDDNKDAYKNVLHNQANR